MKIRVATTAGLFTIGDGAPVMFQDQDVNSLAPGLAIVGGNEIWRESNGDWDQLSSGTEHRFNCALRTDDSILIGTSRAHLLRARDGGVMPLEGFATMEGRSEWFTPWGGPPDVRSISEANDVLFVNIHVGGIARSSDGGEKWAPTIDIASDVHQVHASADGVVLAATARGLATSSDQGGTWEFDDANLHASYARAVARSGNTLLMSACVGPFGGRSAIYRRGIEEPGGFEKCEKGLPDWFSDNIDTGCLAASEEGTAFGTSEGEVYFSEDLGDTWDRVVQGLPPVRWLLVEEG